MSLVAGIMRVGVFGAFLFSAPLKEGGREGKNRRVGGRK